MPRDLLFWADGKTPRVDLDLLMPAFVERLLRVLARCRQRGCDYYVTSGTRLWAEQAALHAASKAGTGGRAAPPGHSAHQFGLAIDLAYDANPRARGLQPRWEPADYDVLIEEAEREGLHSGHTYNDRPHISWPGYVTSKDLAPLREVWARTEGDTRAKLQAVWLHVASLAA